ncbi:hypothetical protein TCDM_12501 [Trypanosoma cruzi Dm28c]|uniref:Uncharacterized protein n=1 Tax=Trypanosoma cruzi Dm28c TaxID=1416333 RepID=V5CLE6_TRYCR|nr:hypothetical protein TCDM_12501 [Trypanosoma cruzi Dm28c]
MCNFVCGNANAPRRVSHLLWIKFHGANVGAKIPRCVARGRPHNAHGASTHHTSHTRCSTPTGKETRGAHSLSSLLLLMAMEEDNSRHTQLSACTTKEASKSTAMCILCVCGCVCACRQTKQRRRKEGAECVERRTHKKECTAEVHGRNKGKKTAQAHDIALRLKQWQFTQDLSTKKSFPPHLI